MSIKYPTTKNLIQEVVNLAKADAIHGDALLADFIAYFYFYTALEDLEKKSPEVLYHIALSHWNLLRSEKKAETIRLRVFNPTLEADGWSSDHTVIQVIVQDMPFLVDSLCMELTRLNLSFHTLIHMGGYGHFARSHWGSEWCSTL